MEEEYMTDFTSKRQSVPITVYNFEPPKSKKMKLSNECAEIQTKIGEKRKREEMKSLCESIGGQQDENMLNDQYQDQDHNHQIDYKQMYLKESQLSKSLTLELQKANEEKTKWKEKFKKLHFRMKRLIKTL